MATTLRTILLLTALAAAGCACPPVNFAEVTVHLTDARTHADVTGASVTLVPADPTVATITLREGLAGRYDSDPQIAYEGQFRLRIVAPAYVTTDRTIALSHATGGCDVSAVIDVALDPSP